MKHNLQLTCDLCIMIFYQQRLASGNTNKGCFCGYINFFFITYINIKIFMVIQKQVLQLIYFSLKTTHQGHLQARARSYDGDTWWWLTNYTCGAYHPCIHLFEDKGTSRSHRLCPCMSRVNICLSAGKEGFTQVIRDYLCILEI